MGDAESDQFEMPVEPKVLQTQTVPLNEVMANLPEWVDAPRAEYTSLTEGTNATKPVHKDTLRHRTDVEYAPGKLVATLKPGNKKKARLVVCGNRVEVSDDNQVDQDGSSEYANKGRKTYDTYARGIDGVCVRAVLRKAGERRWNCASIDVRTAFLLAPRRGTGTLVVKPLKVLTACGLIPATEM